MKFDEYLDGYFDLINDKIKSVHNGSLKEVISLLNDVRSHAGKVIIVGNGGSAAIASHVSIDLTKTANIRAINFNESSLLTCFSNDYGYECWVEKAIGFYADANDLIILISSSGQSDNIINGALKAKDMGLPLVTLSGFKEDNPLKKLGDVNLWIDSDSYNIIEAIHQVWLLSIVDCLVENVQ